MSQSSKPLNHVMVKTPEETYAMPNEQGKKLMHHLTQPDIGSHVMITTVEGDEVLLNKHEIKNVKVFEPAKTYYKTPAQLGMPDLSKPLSTKDIVEMRHGIGLTTRP